jgi:hypothetical protein
LTFSKGILLIRGTDPTYIAQRVGNRVFLSGEIDSTGAFRKLEWMQTPISKGKWQVQDSSDILAKKELFK